jgi:ribosomal protein S27AE
MPKFRDCWTHDALKPGEFAQVTCSRCGRTEMFAPHVFTRMFARPVPIPVAEARFRCGWCGRKAAVLRRVWRSMHG